MRRKKNKDRVRLTGPQLALLSWLAKKDTVVRVYFTWHKHKGVGWHSYLLVGSVPRSDVRKEPLDALVRHGFIKAVGVGVVGYEGEITKEGREWLEGYGVKP